MKQIIFTLLSLGIFTAMFAQTQTPTVTPAKSTTTAATESSAIDFEKTTHDFGDLDEGPKASVDFTFTNTSDKPLILKNVKASCGCTTPKWPKEPIAPGEEGVITAVYNTKNRPGPFNKAITVTTADGEVVRVYIKGKVLKVDPDQGMPVKEPSMLTPDKKNG